MITWAMVYYAVKSANYNGFWFMAAMFADVMIVYYVCEVAK